MKFLIGYFVKKFGISALVIAISIFYFGAVIAFYVFIVNSLITIYNLIQNFLNLISSVGSSDTSSVLNLFGSLLNTMGFFPALNDTMPLIISSITFLLTKALWKYTLQTYRSIVQQVTEASMVL